MKGANQIAHEVTDNPEESKKIAKKIKEYANHVSETRRAGTQAILEEAIKFMKNGYITEAEIYMKTAHQLLVDEDLLPLLYISATTDLSKRVNEGLKCKYPNYPGMGITLDTYESWKDLFDESSK